MRRLRFPDTKNRPILNPLWVSVEMTGTLTHEGTEEEYPLRSPRRKRRRPREGTPNPREDAPSAKVPAEMVPSARPGDGISTLFGGIRREVPRVHDWRGNLDPRFRARNGLTCCFLKPPSKLWSRNGAPASHSGPFRTDFAG